MYLIADYIRDVSPCQKNNENDNLIKQKLFNVENSENTRNQLIKVKYMALSYRYINPIFQDFIDFLLK